MTFQGALGAECLGAALAVEEELLGLLLLLRHAHPLVDLLVFPVGAVRGVGYNRSSLLYILWLSLYIKLWLVIQVTTFFSRYGLFNRI